MRGVPLDADGGRRVRTSECSPSRRHECWWTALACPPYFRFQGAELHRSAGRGDSHAGLAAAAGTGAAAVCARGRTAGRAGRVHLAGIPGRPDRPDQAEAVLGVIDAADRRRNSRSPWRNWPAGWPPLAPAPRARCWNCWPTSKPASTSPTKTCRSSRPTSLAGTCRGGEPACRHRAQMASRRRARRASARC